MNWNTWLPPLMASGVGLATGAVLVWRAAGTQTPAEEAHALRAHKAALMERLRELEVERPKLPSEVWQSERQALVKQAAETLRKIDALEARGHRRPTSLVGPVMVVGSVALCALGMMAWPDDSSSATPVSLDQPPARTQASSGMGGMGAPSSMAEVTSMAGSLPDDLAELNSMAYDAILQGQLPLAMSAVEKARQIAPEDPLVKTHLNIMRINVGMVAKAGEGLEEVVQAHPDQPRPVLWLAYAKGNLGDDEAAKVLLEKVLDMAPASDEATMARQWMMEIDSAAGQAQ